MSFEIGQNVVILPATPGDDPIPGVVVARRALRDVEFFLVRHFHSVSQVEKWLQAHQLSAGYENQVFS